MRRALPNVLPWLILIGASTVTFFVLRSRESAGAGWSWNNPTGHFWIVSAAALICAVLALAAGTTARRTANWRVTLISLSFIAMAGIFSVHGLATPGFIVSSPGAPSQGPAFVPATGGASGYDAGDAYDGGYGASAPGLGGSAGGSGATGSTYLNSYFPSPNDATPAATAPSAPTPSRFYNVTGVSSRLAVLSSITLLAIAAMRWPSAVEGWLTRRRHLLLTVGIVAVLGYAALAFLAPWLVPTVLARSSAASFASTLIVTVLGLTTAIRFAMSYRFSGIQLHGAAAIGAILIVEAQFSIHFGATWSGTFWLYHVQLLTGFAAIFWGVVIEFSQGHTVRSLESLTVSDVLRQLRSGFAEPVVALSAALEARDGYTLGHGERVAALAVLIGQEMRVTPRQLRAIAAGSLLHDVGKVGIPDAVLHKPAGLSDDEYAVIKEHPARGSEMLRHHFDQKVEANVIRHHHERWDGLGYPDGLSGTSIPLEARIAAVADVYDALRSNRSYRPAFPRENAVPIILDGIGSHFDPDCVDAFVRVVAEWESRHVGDEIAYQERRVA
ncbi:MAG: HD-GYP domain-containing protein [Chloroflexi bacterium]|nr:HD-GYP domain-containing protein [Chloroflexota bacterium]